MPGAHGAIDFTKAAPDQPTFQVPVTAFWYNRLGKTVKLSTQVLAPFCWCHGKPCNTQELLDQACTESYPDQGYSYFLVDSDTDINGNTCKWGAVPKCGALDGHVEYAFDSTATLAVSAPHANLPKPPAFLQEIMDSFNQQ